MVTDCPSCNSKSLFWLDNNHRILSCNKCKCLFVEDNHIYISRQHLPENLSITFWGQFNHWIDLDELARYDGVQIGISAMILRMAGRELIHQLEMFKDFKEYPYQYHLYEDGYKYALCR